MASRNFLLLKIFKHHFILISRISRQEIDRDWLWDLMYEDLTWASEILNDKTSSERDRRMASVIYQAWMGDAAHMRVHHIKDSLNVPIDA